MTAGLTLRDGPYMANQATVTSRNIELWLLVLPQYFLAIVICGPGIVPRFLAVLAGSFLACLAIRRNRAGLANLDWFVSAWLVAALSFDSQFYLDSFFRGLACGLISARPGPLKNLMALPPLTSLIVLVISWLTEWLRMPASFMPYVQQMLPLSWSEAVVLISAGGCFLFGKTGGLWRLCPWLAGALGLGAEMFIPAVFQQQTYWYFMMSSRAAFTALAIFFIIPQLTLPRKFFWILELSALALLLSPLFYPGVFRFDPLIFGGLVILLLLIHHRHLSAQIPAKEKIIPVETAAKARLACAHQGDAPHLAEWEGLASCRLAAVHDDGPLLCPYGCLGLGDCVRKCPFGAITLDEKSWPVFNETLCRGCGSCAAACPKNLIRLVHSPVRIFVACASLSGLKKNSTYCPQACLGCSRCRKACPAGAIGRPGQNGAMIIDQEICRLYGPDCGRACVAACPRHILDVGLKS